MKKIIITISVFILILAILFVIHKDTENTDSNVTKTEKKVEEVSKTPYVSYNKWLHTKGAKLLNENDETIQLKGISSHGIQWYSDLLTYDNLKNLKENWNINVFRIAVYTENNGYISYPEEIKNKVIEVSNIAIDLDLYVIIDWHILSDNDPNIHINDSKVFFEEMSRIYSNCPNIIYEICNEPNSNYVSWNEYIKPYAEQIIPIIRNNSPKSLIIVGTPVWCQNLKDPADSPLNFENILYSCHFYSGTHGEDLRNEVKYALDKGIPVFVSECGTTDASGNGEIYLDEFKKWIDFLDENDISWINWSFSTKDESSAILTTNYPVQTEDSSTYTTTTQSNNTTNTSDIDENVEKSANINDYLTPSR